MRNILFRGKRVDNGEWVYGYLLQNNLIVPIAQFFTYCKDNIKKINILSMSDIVFVEVIPETVGQYTGLTDKNGTKIFEGDILKCSDTNCEYEFIAYIEFGNPNGFYSWGWQLHFISGGKSNLAILLWCDTEEDGVFSEVIGNIHDNPELLKGGAE